MTVFTIGHSTRSLEDFIAALQAARVDGLADIRRFPYSRRHPQFNGETLGPALAEVGILYRHFPALGGRRGKRDDGTLSPHTLWREPAFRNYADYAETPEFRAAFDALLAMAKTRTIAIMCAESLWWQCHRRIVTDYLLAAGLPVEHIFDAKKREAAKMTEGAVARGDGTILYEGPQPRLL
jgi:uncharacterized protein (DUF488 family)